ncbi:hypothetical protein BDP27DRAFT_1210466 [Rhodocollybia butyracea]|uniref:Uncharacterized protein n=1 Tax=Rhodocollybia butyracea TaxID=206335 RepID=A0A9P5Q6L2_9AGAR|nr:hypothetical protein BDP27DRAFT_1210466 [Rhodocollybia butyracea]
MSATSSQNVDPSSSKTAPAPKSLIPSVIWKDENGAIHVDVPPRMFVLPGVAFIVGSTIGIIRGGRATSLRFLAENAHRPPRTVKGWYFYNKTKNYKVILGGLKGAAKESTKLVAFSVGWVGIEEGLGALGGPMKEVKEVGAGLGTAGLFCGVYRLPWRTTRQTILLGGLIGGIVKILSSAKERLKEP